ncbi:hypothetical protein, partial [Corynebacterium heidelbergense]
TPNSTPTATPTRSAGALVVIAGGRCLAHLTRGGRSITLFPSLSFADTPTADTGAISGVLDALRAAIRSGRLSPVTVERINGQPVLDADTRPWVQAGARLTPKGLTVR